MEINQETLMKASFLEKESNKLGEQLEMIENQIQELEQFSINLASFSKNQGKDILATLGKGVHTKAQIQNKDLYVEVGSGIVVKKTPEQIKKVIEGQVKRLKEAKLQIQTRMDIYSTALQELVHQIEQMQAQKQ